MEYPSKECVACLRELTHLRNDLWECPVHGVFNMPEYDAADLATGSVVTVFAVKLCPQIDSCPRIDMIMDKDILDFQAADAIRSVCANCTEVVSA